MMTASSRPSRSTKPSSTSNNLTNCLPSSAFQDYADVSLKVAMHINSSLNEPRSIESQDLAKPVSSAKRRRYEDLQKVLAAYDSSDWGDVLVAGVLKSEAINKVFPA
jgi:hypothetical protein